MKYDALLSNTEALINQMFWYQQTLSHPTAASHRALAIKYVDVKEMRQSFLRELKSTALNWVYSRNKYDLLFQAELAKRGGDVMNVQSYLYQVADQKFRKGCPQGQFGELLLFNFIQHFFKAPPLLRKMRITTNPALERHGADAIHYNEDSGKHFFILGESKCYESKYQFNTALQKSVDSIFTSFENLEDELILYQMDDFIDPELQEVGLALKDGKLSGVHFDLVCLVTYEENVKVLACTEQEIKDKIEKCVLGRWAQVPATLYTGRSPILVSRIHYIVFPAWNLDTLLAEF